MKRCSFLVLLALAALLAVQPVEAWRGMEWDAANSKLTFTSTVAFSGTVTYDGATTLGNAATDAITLTGYLTRLRVGTGSTAGLTHSSDDAFIEGQLEVDSTTQLDGDVNLGNSASADTVTVTADVTLNAGTAVTSPDGCYFTRLRVGTGSTPGENSATAADGLFVEGVAEVDGVFQADGNVDLGNSASADTVTITADITLDAGTAITSPSGAYATQWRVGTGSTPGDSNSIAADGLFVEGAAEIDGDVRFDGGVILGDATGDTVTINADTVSMTDAGVIKLETIQFVDTTGLIIKDPSIGRITITTTGDPSDSDVSVAVKDGAGSTVQTFLLWDDGDNRSEFSAALYCSGTLGVANVATFAADVDLDATGGTTADPDFSVDGYAQVAKLCIPASSSPPSATSTPEGEVWITNATPDGGMTAYKLYVFVNSAWAAVH